MRRYVAVIHKENDSDFGVSFPDFPGVVTAGPTVAEACELAEQALAFHVEGLLEDGEPVPEPTLAEPLTSDKDVLETVRVRLRPPGISRVGLAN
ncbi:type II toxin-antitoxin system HicB family antitoxin [Mesorhizobium sp. VK4C]|uniref:type II toxin-antitoxin system HicB family antitoxin n=1 Tax=Mesorhizobium captivum TaxID=3072319 RepID=UPI002A244951|nr:type II toxin-antitoxin system HicB family antitoxin [Mesorhizobium sp. VK4C]MDX8501934.1 type II toxin-antitoxin system HicB family antitoxin [Mesorhizobium sp. VK4C]